MILGVRNTKAAEDVVKQIQERYPGAKLVVGPSLDLLSQKSVKEFADWVNKTFPKLDILVNNAGVSFMQRTMTPEGVGGIAQVRGQAGVTRGVGCGREGLSERAAWRCASCRAPGTRTQT